STITRRPDCDPVGTDRSSSQPRYKPSTIAVLPPGSVTGTSAITFVLSNPRVDGIGSSTLAPSLNVSSATRSCAASNELMKLRAASATALHCGPIELDTSITSDRSTMRRVAWPELDTVTSLKLASRMNVVGSVAVAVTVTTFTPVVAMTWD